ncbi:MAG: ABC transporter permease, partial [Bacteroidota bacterium]|nr:ABC transporter permease [Bacteroidota bacterium]
LSLLFVVSLYGVNYIAYEVQINAFAKAPIAQAVAGAPPFQFPEVWNTVTWISGFLLFFPGLIIIILMTNEFSYKTHRQNIIDGLSRTQFIYVKMMMCVLIALFSTLIVFIVALLFGFTEGHAGFNFHNTIYLPLFFIQALSYTSLALLIATLFRRSGIAIGVYFLYAEIIDQMLSMLCSHYFNNIGRYFPLESNDNLIPLPLFRNIIGKMIEPPNVYYMLITAAIYLSLYFFICRQKFRTADL